MRRGVVFILALLIAGAVSAQVRVVREEPKGQPDEQTITHGEFAVLLLEVIATQPGEAVAPEQALAEVKMLELVPQSWQVDDLTTHGDLSDLLLRLGAQYTPVDREAPATRAFTEAILRRELLRLRDYTARRMGHGTSLSHIMDEGVDRGVVSPSGF